MKKKIFTIGITAMFVVMVFTGCKPQIEYKEKIVEKEKVVEKYILVSKTTQDATNVLHMHQSLNGLSYVQVEEETKSVKKETEMSSLSKTYVGFTAMGMIQNGEKVTILYDRNIITYTFKTGSEGKLSDGTTERIAKGLYGASVPIPIVSSSTHYFGGWFTSSNTAPGSTFGEEDLIFTVKWTSKDAGVYNWYETPVDVESGELANSSSTYVYFGVFPKTVLPSDTVITVDETETMIMGANTYYKGNDGNWYAKVTENAFESYYKYTDGTTVKQKEAASTRYFKVEPIKWKVLTTDYNGTKKALLLAEEILTADVPYYVDWNERTIGGNTVYANNYKYSTIRAYLNGKYEDDDTQEKTAYENKGFLQTAFTASAQLMITITAVDNSKETTGDSEDTYANDYWCEDTEDKIFLLSEIEGINSSYDIRTDMYNYICIRKTTDYAKAKFEFMSIPDSFGGYWYSRSPSYYRSFIVQGFGSDYETHNTGIGIVPALTISF